MTRMRAVVVELQQTGTHTIVELAELFNVSRPTVYRVLDRAFRVST
ncbi:helix-turn-helix domain-containing protein [Nocardia sp. CWNU-33]